MAGVLDGDVAEGVPGGATPGGGNGEDGVADVPVTAVLSVGAAADTGAAGAAGAAGGGGAAAARVADEAAAAAAAGGASLIGPAAAGTAVAPEPGEAMEVDAGDGRAEGGNDLMNVF